MNYNMLRRWIERLDHMPKEHTYVFQMASGSAITLTTAQAWQGIRDAARGVDSFEAHVLRNAVSSSDRGKILGMAHTLWWPIDTEIRQEK